MILDSDIRTQMGEEGISPAEKIGQHILVDTEAIKAFVEQVEEGCDVLEIGAGPGNLTRLIAKKAKKVVTIELDQRFKPFLDQTRSECPNVEVVYGDALAVNFRDIVEHSREKGSWQIVSSLPFHISEPFMHRLVKLPIRSAVLIIGDNLARRMGIDNPDSLEFSKLSLLTNTFFEREFQSHLPRSAFFPPPRTDASLVTLTPRQKEEYERNLNLHILRNLFLSEGKNPTVIKVIKDSQGDFKPPSTKTKTERHRYSRRILRSTLTELTKDPSLIGSRETQRYLGTMPLTNVDLPAEILNKPFSKLDNTELRALTKALAAKYGQFN